MRLQLALSACVLVAAIPTAWAAGGGSMPAPRAQASSSPEDQAKSMYNRGVSDVRKADKYQDSLAQLSDGKKKDKAVREAQEHYGAALNAFAQAVKLDPSMHEAWNYVGYTNRKLGHYDVALEAYQRA